MCAVFFELKAEPEAVEAEVIGIGEVSPEVLTKRKAGSRIVG